MCSFNSLLVTPVSPDGRTKFILLPMMVCILALMSSGCAGFNRITNLAGGNGIGDEFRVVCSTYTLKQGAVSHAKIVPFSTNRIVVTYFASEGQEGKSGRMACDWPAYSDDEGKTWQYGDPFIWKDGKPKHIVAVTSQQVVVRNEGHYGYFFGFTIMSNNNRYASEFLVRISKDGRYLGKAVASEGGNEWTGPFEVEFKMPDGIRPGFLVLPARGIETKDGHIGMVMYGRIDKKYATYYLVSSDKGRTFDYRSTVATISNAPWGAEGPCEAAVIELSSGELLCMMRTGSGAYGNFGKSMLESRSKDGGFIWKSQKTTIGGVMPKLLKAENGNLYMLYGRPGNELAVSRNEGHSWSTIGSMSPADYHTSGYVDGVEISGGRFLVVYDRWQQTTQKVWLWEPPAAVNCIMGRYVQIK